MAVALCLGRVNGFQCAVGHGMGPKSSGPCPQADRTVSSRYNRNSRRWGEGQRHAGREPRMSGTNSGYVAPENQAVNGRRPQEPPLIFVHLGPNLPRHFLPSLERAGRTYSGEVIGLVDCGGEASQSNPKFQLVEINDFYDPRRFHHAAQDSALDSNFREGFWHKTFERFFVLEQYAARHSLQRYFHAESDVITFNLDGLAARLNRFGEKLFIPRDSRSRAIASLIYVNGQNPLEPLLVHIESAPLSANEMEVLASFMDSHQNLAIALPTLDALESLVTSSGAWQTLTPADTGGIFDAAGLGQWIGGTDPRNSSKIVRNHFRNEQNSIRFSDLHARFEVDQNTLRIRLGGQPSLSVHNLHLHSKMDSVFRSDLMLSMLVQASNLNFSLPMNPIAVVERSLGWTALRQSSVGRKIEIFANKVKRQLHSLPCSYLRKSVRPAGRPQSHVDQKPEPGKPVGSAEHQNMVPGQTD